MKMKVLTIDVPKMNRNSMDYSQILGGRILEEASFEQNRFFAFKHIIESRSNDHGIMSRGGDLKSLEDRLLENGDKLIKCRFVVVDIYSQSVYYDGNQNDIKVLLKELFGVEHNNIHFVTNIDSFHRLKQIRIKTSPYGQISIADDIKLLQDQTDMIEDLCDPGSVASTTYEVNFKEKGTLFNTKAFKRIASQQKKGLVTITANGFDEDGNVVKLSSQISKEVLVLTDITKWEQKLDLQLNRLLAALIEEVKLEDN